MSNAIADDDIYVNNGQDFQGLGGDYYPGQPSERKEEEQVKAAPKALSYPILADVAKWFDEQIADASDINNIQVATMTVNGTKFSRTVSVEAQVLAYQLLKDLLQSKANDFADFKGDEE